MFVLIRAGITFFVSWFAICNAAAQQNLWLKTEIDKIIRFDTEINFDEVPGFIIGIKDGDSTYIYSYGQKDTEKKSDRLTGTDIFEIGSITKLYTARIIRVLEAENKLSGSDKVNNYLPEEFQNPRLQALTIHDLINHQSGLPLRPEMFGARELDSQNPYLYYTTYNVLTYYRDYIPEKKGFVYSHTNYALLEIIIQRVTNMDFEDVVYEYITKPYQLNHTFVDFPEQKENYIAPGFDKSGKKIKPWTFSSFRASEGLKTSAEDALTFLDFVLSDPDSVSAAVEIPTNKENKTDRSFNEHLFIENGWHVIPVKGKKVSIHTGRTSGHSCFVGMVKETRTAVVVMSNGWIGTGDLGLQILRLINQNWKF